MNYKKFVVNIVPYGLAKKVLSRRFRTNHVIQYDPTLPDIPSEVSKFKNVIAIMGLGFSGSGAVIDFLREFENCLVLGTIDEDGSVAKGNRNINGEINILRNSGGLFEIEKYLSDNNLFSKDALMKRFRRLVNSSPIFENPASRQLVNMFYNQIIELEIDTRGQEDFNGHLANVIYPDCNIKIMKRLEQSQYIDLCKRFLTKLFNQFSKDSYSYLVMDQLVSDFNYDFKRYKDYIPNIKVIIVVRDPRDTYAYSLMKDVPWIAHDSVDNFITWYKACRQLLKSEKDDYMLINFEDLVLDYDNVSKTIIQYLNLEGVCRNQFSCLDPEVSKKNISIWKTVEGRAQEMDQIYDELKEYCFQGR